MTGSYYFISYIGTVRLQAMTTGQHQEVPWKRGKHTTSTVRWSPGDIEVLADHHWWSTNELTTTSDVVFPTDLAGILASVGVSTGE
jgi:hypothetical protein